MPPASHTLDWHGIAVSVSVSQPAWLDACRRAGGATFVHLEVRADEPLPITETGYVSHFVTEEALNAEGGPLRYVRTWLDTLALQRAWRDRPKPTAQLALF